MNDKNSSTIINTNNIYNPWKTPKLCQKL